MPLVWSALLLEAALAPAEGAYEVEARIIEYLKAEVRPGQRVVVSELVNEVFTTEDKFAPQYTDDPETAKLEKTRVDTGIESLTELERHWEEEKVNLKSQLKLFSTFEDPATVDIFWNTKATANVLSFVNVILEAEISYDEDILRRTQLKEVLSVGLTHTFF